MSKHSPLEAEVIYQSPMTNHVKITVGDHTVEGVEVKMPGTTQYFLAITCAQGMLACRLVDLAVAERHGLALAIFSAARLENILEGKPVALSQKAQELGATLEMTGEEIITVLS